MQACVHACYVLVFLGWIRKMKVSMESGEHNRPIWVHNTTQAHKLACMHAMFLCAQAHISAKWGLIRKIMVSMELGEHGRPVLAHNMSPAHKLACMHAMFLHAWTQILAKFCQISKMKVSMECQDYFFHVWTYSRSYEGAGGPKRGQRPPTRAEGPLTAHRRS